MARHTFFLVCATVLLAVAGCTHGTGDYRDIQRLAIGSSAAAQCDHLFDTPVARRSSSAVDRTFEWRTYDLLANNGSSRLLTVELLDGVVNGYSYVSTADEDRTVANVPAAAQLRSGASTRQDALQLLGPPSGRVKLPSGFAEFRDANQHPDLAEAWIWLEVINPGSWSVRQRAVHVIFDRTGRVFQTATLDRPLPPPPRAYAYYAYPPPYYSVVVVSHAHHHH